MPPNDANRPSAVPPGTPLEQNRFITQGYIRTAYALQELLDPQLVPNGASDVRPNWFALAPHASQEAGKGMLGAAIARRIIDAAQGELSPSVAAALDKGGLAGPSRLAVEKLAEALRWHGLPRDAAAALGALVGAMNLEALSDPRTLWTTALRLACLYLDAPGAQPLDKVESIVRTMERLLNEGNVAIFTDVGTSADLYLKWRASAGALVPDLVLRGFTLPGARPAESRRAFETALAKSPSWPAAPDFANMFPGFAAQSLMVAAFALFEQARQSPGPAARDAHIAAANLFLAWREQRDAVQPAFSPAVPPRGEVSRPALMRAMTPLLCVTFGGVRWNFTEYAEAQKDRDGNPLTSKPTEYNWDLFKDRWPAILSAFNKCYGQPTALWAMPAPLPQP
ncbi:hypothetical protein P2318_33510 [Myxococcaceae bacterium GXIMD 01537]